MWLDSDPPFTSVKRINKAHLNSSAHSHTSGWWIVSLYVQSCRSSKMYNSFCSQASNYSYHMPLLTTYLKLQLVFIYPMHWKHATFFCANGSMQLPCFGGPRAVLLLLLVLTYSVKLEGGRGCPMSIHSGICLSIYESLRQKATEYCTTNGSTS